MITEEEAIQVLRWLRRVGKGYEAIEVGRAAEGSRARLNAFVDEDG